MQHKNITDKKNKIIFVNPAEVKSLPVPPCEYVFAKRNVVVPMEQLINIKTHDADRPMPKMYLNSKLIHFKLDKNALVFQDTGDVADVSEDDIKTTARHHRYVQIESQIPNGLFEKASTIKLNWRVILTSYVWRTKHPWVYVTLGKDHRYVPKPYKIKFDEGTGMHFVEEGPNKFQVTTRINLDILRLDLQDRVRIALAYIEKNNITFNDALILKNTITNTLYIAAGPENVSKYKQALDIFLLKLRVNIEYLPFTLSNFPWQQQDSIDVIFQEHFPDTIIAHQIGKYHGSSLFFDGNPRDAIRITCSHNGMLTINQETYHAPDYLKYTLSTLCLIDNFEIIKLTKPSTFIFLFKDPSKVNNLSLPEIIEILFNDLLRLGVLLRAFSQTPTQDVTQTSNVAAPQIFEFNDFEPGHEIPNELSTGIQDTNDNCNNFNTIPTYRPGSPYFFPSSPSNDFMDHKALSGGHKHNIDDNEIILPVNKTRRTQ